LDKESGWIEVSAEIIKNDGAKYGEWKEEGSFMQYYCEEHGGPMYTVSWFFVLRVLGVERL
jgi:hypothetical protein